jgi:hypothetical protein
VLTVALNAVKLKEGWFDMSLVLGLLGKDKSMQKLAQSGGLGLGAKMVSSLIGGDDKEEKELKKELERERAMGRAAASQGMKKGGSVKSSASKRADGCAQRGKTRGKMV